VAAESSRLGEVRSGNSEFGDRVPQRELFIKKKTMRKSLGEGLVCGGQKRLFDTVDPLRPGKTTTPAVLRFSSLLGSGPDGPNSKPAGLVKKKKQVDKASVRMRRMSQTKRAIKKKKPHRCASRGENSTPQHPVSKSRRG